MGNEYGIKPFSSPYEEGIEYSKLKGFLGSKGAMVEPHDEVCRSDIIHWCEVMHDDNPLYTDEEYAKNSEYGGIIAPPASVQAFTIDTFYAAMARFRDGVTIDIEEPHSQVFSALDAAGYSSVMATRQDLEVHNQIKLGDRIYCHRTPTRISDCDHHTRQGVARYVDTTYSFYNQDNVHLSDLVFTVIKYKPPVTTRALYKG